MAQQQSGESPVLEQLAKMTTDSIEASGLDPKTLMLVRIAGLIAVDAPPASYLLNVGIAGEAGVDAEQVQGVLIALAPIVGTARIASAATKLVRALNLAINLAELEEAEGTAGT
jgi:alkylhydroperoxidase/carboxymuconolactone decarboxylase family protein YurZ